MKKWSILCISVLLLLIIPVSGIIDSNINGRITGEMNAGVPGAAVVAKNTATNMEYTATSDAKGEFNLAVPPGSYLVTASLAGNTAASGPVVVAGGLTVTVNLQINVKGASPNITSGYAESRANINGDIYAGDNIRYNLKSDEIDNYSVQGKTYFTSMKTGTKISSGTGLLGGLIGANIAISSIAGVGSKLSTDNANIFVHDNPNGNLQVMVNQGSIVQISLTGGSSATYQGEKYITVRNPDGSESSFLIAGNGKLEMRDGKMVADLDNDGQLIFKAYPVGKTQLDDAVEQGIIDGIVAAEINIPGKNDAAASSSISYSSAVSAKVNEVANEKISILVSSSNSVGKTIAIEIDSSRLPFQDPGQLEVRVDGEVAAKASSTSELYATGAGDKPRYLVAKAEGATKVMVAINHFSDREVTLAAKPSSPAESTQVPPASPTEKAPGFEVVLAIAIFLTVYRAGRKR